MPVRLHAARPIRGTARNSMGRMGQDDEDDSGSSGVGVASGLNEKGGTEAWIPTVPGSRSPSSQAAGASDGAAAQVILAILLIPSILSPLPFPSPQEGSATTARSNGVIRI